MMFFQIFLFVLFVAAIIFNLVNYFKTPKEFPFPLIVNVGLGYIVYLLDGFGTFLHK